MRATRVAEYRSISLGGLQSVDLQAMNAFIRPIEPVKNEIETDGTVATEQVTSL